MKEKTFYKRLMEFSLFPEKAKQCLADKRLTVMEKQILDGYLMIRSNQNLQVLELFKKNIPCDSKFVESQKLLLLGCASNNLSQYAQAEKYLGAAIEILQDLEAPYFHFFAYFALFWIKANLHDTKSMESMLVDMKKIPIASEHQRQRLLRCQFCFYQMVEKNAEAMNVLKEIEALRNTLSESDIIQFLNDKFIFYIQLEDFPQAYDVLKDMKNFRKFHVSENYKFMKKLLDHLTQDCPIYAYAQDFAEIPLLFHQIKVIQALEENKLDVAKDHWHSLQSISQDVYQDEFRYSGTKCLFSLCLRKHRHQLDQPVQLKRDENLTHMDALIRLLSISKTPLAAGLIFEVIWGRVAETKEDLMKLTRLISRAKTELDFNIEYRKGTYQLKVKPSAKVS